jgi:hypothetical protein
MRLATTSISSASFCARAIDALKQVLTNSDEYGISFIVISSMKIKFHEGETKSRGQNAEAR